MGANLIYPFAQGAGANVQTTTTYNADSQRTIGNQSGTARSSFVNKALKQATALVAGLAQFIVDNQGAGGADVTDDLLASAISTMMKAAVKGAAQNPPGSIVFVPGSSPLNNTVKVNGVLLSRSTYANLYAFASTSGNMAASDGAWVSGQFSPGDGSTTFRIPDLRGYHLRAWDDGRGIDTGRVFGSVQVDQLLAHAHALTDPGHTHTANVSDPGHGHSATVSDPGHGHTANVSDPTHTHSVVSASVSTNSDLGTLAGSSGFTGGFNHGSNGSYSGYVNNAYTGISVGIVGSSTGITVAIGSAGSGISVALVANTTGISVQNSSGGSEVRVKNIALMPCIYY
jgi:microcystin-dependent protein